MKTVCQKHQVAHEIALGCPWCAPEPTAKKERLSAYTGHEALDVLMVFNMQDTWEARLCQDAARKRVLEVGTDFYEYSTDPNENIVESFLNALQLYRERVWNDKSLFLVRTLSSPRDPGERNLALFLTKEGFEVGVTTSYRFFLSDPASSIDACNQLNISYINKIADRFFYRDLVCTVVDDLGLKLTVV